MMIEKEEIEDKGIPMKKGKNPKVHHLLVPDLVANHLNQSQVRPVQDLMINRMKRKL